MGIYREVKKQTGSRARMAQSAQRLGAGDLALCGVPIIPSHGAIGAKPRFRAVSKALAWRNARKLPRLRAATPQRERGPPKVAFAQSAQSL